MDNTPGGYIGDNGKMNKAKQFRKFLAINRKTFLGFELVFKLITVFIAMPLLLGMFDLVMKISGYHYLTLENIASFLVHPFTVLFLLLLLFLTAAYNLFDMVTVFLILDQSYRGKKIAILDAVRQSARKCRSLFCSRNIFALFLVLLLLPFLNLGMASGFLSTIQIPQFVQSYIRKHQMLLLSGGIGMAMLALVLLRWIYSLPCCILEKKGLKEAAKRSWQLGKRKHGKDFLFLAAVQIGISAVYSLCLVVGIFLIVLINRIVGRFAVFGSIMSVIIWMFNTVLVVIFMALSVPVSCTGISLLYYGHKKERGEEIGAPDPEEIKQTEKGDRRLRIAISLITAAAVVMGTVFLSGLYRGRYNLNVEYARTMEVTAHRGASADYPENTMSAFRGAKELGADWIELDVHQTKDGKIIVIHDKNFKRVTGVNKNTWELTYDEVKQLDAGSYFGAEFQGERIPLLSEVIEFAKENNIRLNIELKPTGHETDFEKHVVDIIMEYDFAEDCVITSQIYRVMENVKAYQEEIETVYVMGLAYGNITALKAADHFSIEAASVTGRLVSRVHGEGKELYAWTANTRSSIRRMAELHVDNIITDNISLARETVYEEKSSDLLKEYVRMLKEAFR